MRNLYLQFIDSYYPLLLGVGWESRVFPDIDMRVGSYEAIYYGYGPPAVGCGAMCGFCNRSVVGLLCYLSIFGIAVRSIMCLDD